MSTTVDFVYFGNDISGDRVVRQLPPYHAKKYKLSFKRKQDCLSISNLVNKTVEYCKRGQVLVLHEGQLFVMNAQLFFNRFERI